MKNIQNTQTTGSLTLESLSFSLSLPSLLFLLGISHRRVLDELPLPEGFPLAFLLPLLLFLGLLMMFLHLSMWMGALLGLNVLPQWGQGTRLGSGVEEMTGGGGSLPSAIAF